MDQFVILGGVDSDPLVQEAYRRDNFDKQTRNSTVDVIKAICAIFVIAEHYSWTVDESLRFLFPFWLRMEVPMFMILSGFVWSSSYEKRSIACLNDAYGKSMYSKLVRYTIPFIVAYIIEIVYYAFICKQDFSVLEICLNFLSGGYGPGGYYYPVMIQFIFLFPLVYFVIKKYDYKGLMICLVANVSYEILQRAYNLNEETYRLLLFRYTYIVAYGCYLCIGKKIIKKSEYICSFLIGTAFLILYNYKGYEPHIMIYWTKTCFLACFYILPIAAILIRLQIHNKILETIGKASYNICFTQMVYYESLAGKIYEIVGNRIVQLLINVGICVIIGVIFYYLESPITKRIVNRINDFKREEYV